VGIAQGRDVAAVDPHGLMENLDLQIAPTNIDQFQAQLTIAKFDLAEHLSHLLQDARPYQGGPS
jgi:hypothetical protein